MKRFTLSMLALVAAFVMGIPSAQAAMSVGDSVLGMSMTDINGQTHTFDDFAGKTVVLEWNNQGCPFVRKFYNEGAMQGFQKEATAKGVIWITINSGGEGKDGYLTTDEAKDMVEEKGIASTAYVLDPSGEIGHAFGATATPHMFVIDGTGNIAYQGAIDSKPSADPADIETAENYVMAAIDAIAAGEAVETPVTQAYGCGVKYATEKPAAGTEEEKAVEPMVMDHTEEEMGAK